MIERQGRKSLIVCDECSEVFDEHAWNENEFRDMIASAKREGWTVGRKNETWTHKCGPCSPKHRRRPEDMFP